MTTNEGITVKNGQKKFTITNTMYHIFWCLLLVSALLTAAMHFERHSHHAVVKQDLQQQLRKQESVNESLYHELSLYGSDTYIERTASERLGLVKPDEIVFYSSME